MTRHSKYSILLVILMLSIILLSACGNKASVDGDSSDVKELNIMGWAEYYPQNVIDEFKEETGITVNYTTITSNEELVTKLTVDNHGFDLAITSLSHIPVLINQERLEKFNKESIPNLEYLDESFTNIEDGPDPKYFIPAYYSAEIIGINEDLVDKEVNSIKDLFDPVFENDLVAIDDPRVMLGLMLGMLGYSINSTDEKEIEEAGEMLKDLMPNIKSYAASDADRLLISNEVSAGIIYSGKAPMAKRDNPSIKAVIPEVITVAQDNYVIPKGANMEPAEKFIDFVQRPEIQKEIIIHQPYPSPNMEAMDLLPDDVKEELNVVSPEDVEQKGEYILDVGEAVRYYNDVWTAVKN